MNYTISRKTPYELEIVIDEHPDLAKEVRKIAKTHYKKKD